MDRKSELKLIFKSTVNNYLKIKKEIKNCKKEEIIQFEKSLYMLHIQILKIIENIGVVFDKETMEKTYIWFKKNIA